MRILLPEIPEAERTPLIRQLLEIIRLQQERLLPLEERVDQLEDEIARLKGLKTRPRIAPSALETPPRPPRDPQAKRPGSAQRSQTAGVTITEEIVIPLAHRPDGAVFKGYEDFVVPDRILTPRVILYRRERWLTPEGRSRVVPLPAEVVPGRHYGPYLIGFLLHQYHHQPVTPPLLLEELHPLGIALAAGELDRFLTEGKDAFHQEKAELWRWLRQDVLKRHRLAGDWPSLRGRVNQFLGQFAAGSPALLRYVGLSGGGKLARALQVPP